MSRTLFGTVAALCSVALITAPAAACTQDGDARQGTPPGGAWQSADAPTAHMRALLREGKYEQAERYAITIGAISRRQLDNLLGEALVAQGKRDEAAEAFQRAVALGAEDALDARLNAAILDFDRGAVDEALTQFDSFIDAYNGAANLTPEDLAAVGTAVSYLGRRDPQMFRDAVRAYEDAIASDPRYVDARVQMGWLFLDKYNSREARSVFEEALEIDPENPEALTGLAAVLDFDHAPGATEAVDKAFDTNPNLVRARALSARMHAAAERTAEARDEIDRALDVNPSSLDALSVLAAIEVLEDDNSAFEDARGRVAALNPVYPGLYATTADMLAKTRRYEAAARMAAEAVRLDSLSWKSHGLLGINQLRLGHIDEARASLERAFEGDPFNPWFKNTLDLLDTFGRYRRVETQHFEIYLDEREADLLEPYVTRMAEEAFFSLQRKYGYTPPTPIRLEVYPSHADFSVRILGMAGMGALGVAFGSVLAMDSPSARDPGHFNWASTLWHEVAHAFHLGLSKHRVPRWFTEGLAVHEQRAAYPGWGHTPDIAFVRALSEDLLFPVSELNKGFMRPRYPQQVVHSYYQASLVVALIEELHGFGALPSMLRGYAEGKTTDELFRKILDEPVGRFDGRFERHLEERFGQLVEGLPADDTQAAPRTMEQAEAALQERPTDFVARMVHGRLLLEAGRVDEAEERFEEAWTLFPDYAGSEHPLRYLAQIDEAASRPGQAARRLTGLTALAEADLTANLALAELAITVGDSAAARSALERTLWIYPFDADVHRRLAELMMSRGRWAEAVRELEAIIALSPPDLAQALFAVAEAQFLNGQMTSARANVLKALEIAPSYSDALDLLLRIRESLDESSDGVEGS